MLAVELYSISIPDCTTKKKLFISSKKFQNYHLQNKKMIVNDDALQLRVTSNNENRFDECNIRQKLM